jgi:hypothetical protein
MEFVSTKWLLMLGIAAGWTVFFSMFNTAGVRGWRNLGWLACFVLGVVMVFALPWRIACATWAIAGVFSGLVYFAYELFAYAKSEGKSAVSRPNPVTVVHGLVMWPIMLPEAIEYFLAEAGILKAPVQYQLVLQFRGDALDDFDAMVALETALVAELGNTAEVDGHDMGSGEINIFILTSNPVSAFEKSRVVLSQLNLLAAVTAAYRLVSGEVYTVVWPATFHGKFVVA